MNIQIRFSEKLPLKGTNFILLFFFFSYTLEQDNSLALLFVLYLTSNPVRRILIYSPSKKSNIERIIQTLIQFNVGGLSFFQRAQYSFSLLFMKKERERERRLLIHESSSRNGPVISITIPRAATKFCRRSYPNARYRSATQKKLCLSAGLYRR